MKKLLCVFLTLTISLFALPFSAAAASGVTVEKENAYLQVGEKVTLNITFDAGRQVQAFGYTVQYDGDKLEFVGVSDGIANNYESGKVMYINTGDDTLFTATFVFKAKAVGDTSVYVTDVSAADTDEHYYPSVSYSFIIENAKRGDADGDGVVNTTDLATLKLHLAGTVSQINDLADYNKDSFIDTTDLASLKLYLAEV